MSRPFTKTGKILFQRHGEFEIMLQISEISFSIWFIKTMFWKTFRIVMCNTWNFWPKIVGFNWFFVLHINSNVWNILILKKFKDFISLNKQLTESCLFLLIIIHNASFCWLYRFFNLLLLVLAHAIFAWFNPFMTEAVII